MKVKFKVDGMHCSACSAEVERAAKRVNGVTSATVNLMDKLLVAEGESFDAAAVIAEVKKAGYKAKTLADGDEDAAPKRSASLIKLIISIALSAVLMYVSMGMMVGWMPYPHFLHGAKNAVLCASVQIVLTLAVMGINYKFFVGGFKSIIKRSLNMDTLVSMGSLASFIYGIYAFIMIIIKRNAGDAESVMSYMHNLYFDSAAMILALVSLGKFLEEKAKSRTESAVTALKKLIPKTANIVVNGEIKEVQIKDLKTGDVLAVKAGEGFAADCTVVSGAGEANESALTGESMPVSKAVGDKCSAATTLLSGYVEATVTAVGKDTVFSGIIDLVENAELTKAPISRVADKISAIFVPSVITVSIITLIVWLIIGRPFEFCFEKAISVLVVSCPCALGLATPVAVTVAMGMYAKNGVLVKNAETLENVGRITTVAFDKTGTVTKGNIKVASVYGLSETDLKAAAKIESLSSHPVAAAIAEYVSPADGEVTGFNSVQGRGVYGELSGDKYYIGNFKFVEAFEFAASVKEAASSEEGSGKTVLYVAKNQTIIGFISVADEVRDNAAKTIDGLKKSGVKSVIISGDNECVTRAVAKTVGASEFYGGVMPDKKAGIVEELKKSGMVAFVGDGVNDSPALTVADVGIAVAGGTDIAVSSASVVLLKDDLSSVLKTIKTGKRALRIIKENLFWAFFYNVIMIPVAAGVFSALGFSLNPMIASAAMSLSSLFVVSNALRLAKSK